MMLKKRFAVVTTRFETYYSRQEAVEYFKKWLVIRLQGGIEEVKHVEIDTFVQKINRDFYIRVVCDTSVGELWGEFDFAPSYKEDDISRGICGWYTDDGKRDTSLVLDDIISWIVSVIEDMIYQRKNETTISSLKPLFDALFGYDDDEDDLDIEKVIINKPATIICWKDGTKTVVKCQKGDKFDKEKGLLLCYIKRWCCDNRSADFNRFLTELYKGVS